jgi:hypothetical protein
MTPQTVLAVLILLIITIIGLLIYQTVYNPLQPEGFENEKEEIMFCPFKTKLFYQGNEISCCNGKVNGNTCDGKPICSRTGNNDLLGLPSCRKALLDYYALKSKEVCPLSMPNYYEDEQGADAGCTSVSLAASLTSPASMEKPRCRIYATNAENLKHPDSCQNQKELNNVDCSGGIDCVASIVTLEGSSVPLVQLQFSDQDGDRHTCFTDASYKAYKPTSKLFTTAPNEKPCPVLCDQVIKQYIKRDMSA